MNFSEAMTRICAQRARAARKTWNENSPGVLHFVVFMDARAYLVPWPVSIGQHELFFVKMCPNVIFDNVPRASSEPWFPTAADMIADDWDIVADDDVARFIENQAKERERLSKVS